MDEKLSKLIFDSISDGVFTVDKNCKITSFNKAAEHITGFKKSEAVGKKCYDIFRTEICNKQCALKDTLKTENSIDNARVTIITREGCEAPISVTTSMLKDEDGKTIGGVEFFRDISELDHLRKRFERKRELSSIVSVNPQMRELINLLPNVAESDCSVLVRGPSGSGKELFAQVIHNLSPRKYGPYQKVNCAALPAQLLESELFGHEKGAFTDAKKDRPGLFCLADGGTLLLDEIGEMEAPLQAKLLRTLNNGEYRPLGSSKTRKSDARIIAATNSNLENLIESGRFREDLYYRINVVEIDIPPLSERPEDIPLLADFFVKKIRKKTRSSVKSVSPKALAVLRKHAFPGNVRELENAIEHAFVMCRDEEILPEHLPSSVKNGAGAAGSNGAARKNEKEILIDALRRHGGNKTKAAEELGMHRTTLWRKIKILGV